MQSSIERRRLLKAMDAEPVHARMVLAKCAAGLAVIILLAVIGARESVERGVAGGVAAPAAQPVQEHRKHLFDERRARFEGGARRPRMASEAAKPANQLPRALR